jgi:hypothetical protein
MPSSAVEQDQIRAGQQVACGWSIVFFVGIPIGLVGLYLVCRHLPAYGEERSRPLDIIGLILFDSGIALLCNVLEVLGGQRPGTKRLLPAD